MDSEFGYGIGPEPSLGVIPWRNGKVRFPFSQVSAHTFKGGGGRDTCIIYKLETDVSVILPIKWEPQSPLE